MQLRIRNVVKDDQAEFVRIYKEAYRGLEEYAYTSTRDIKWYFRWLMARDKDGFFVAEVNGRPVGFVACDANWVSFFENTEIGEIHEIFVHPDWQGRGIGSKLLERAIEYARSRRRRLAGLWVGVGNVKAKKFYEKFGFREIGVWGRWIRMVREI